MLLWYLLHFIKTLITKRKTDNIFLFSALNTWRSTDDFRCCSRVPESVWLSLLIYLNELRWCHPLADISTVRDHGLGEEELREEGEGGGGVIKTLWAGMRTKKLLRPLSHVAVVLITIIFIMQESRSFVQDVYREHNSCSVSDWTGIQS